MKSVPRASAKALRIAGDSARYFISQCVAQATGILRGLVIPNLLGPGQYGIVSTLILIEQYSKYLNLGIHTNNLYKLPAQRAQNQSEKAEQTKNGVFSVSTLAGGAATLFLLGFAAIRWRHLPVEIRWPLVAASFIPLLINLRAVLMTLLRAEKRFALLAAATNWISIGGMMLAIGLAVWFKAFGVLTAQVLISAVVLWGIQKQCQYRVVWHFRWQSLWELLRFSIPVFFVIGLIDTWLLTLDRIMVIKHFGTLAVGYYAIASLLAMPVTLVPTAVGTVMSTDLIETCSQVPQKAGRQIVQSTYLVALVSVWVAGMMSLFAPLIVRYLFPNYAPAIGAAHWLPIAMYFQSIAMFGYYVVASTGKIRSCIFALLVYAACIYLVFDIGLRGGDLVTAAVLMTVVCALKTFLLLGFTLWETIPDRKQAVTFLRDILLLGGLAAGGCALLHRLWPVGVEGAPAAAWSQTFLKSGFFLIAWAVAAWGLRESIGWGHLRQIVRENWRSRRKRMDMAT